MDFEIPEMPGAAASDAEPELAAPAHRCRGSQPELFAQRDFGLLPRVKMQS